MANTTEKTMVLGGLFGTTALVALYFSGPAVAQVQGSLPAFLKLQTTTPGTPQTGHSNITGTAIAGQFQGGGSSLTNLNASNLASGTVADARLSSNVALLGTIQTFSALKIFGSSFQIPAGGGAGKFLTSDAVGVGSWATLPPPSGAAGGDLGGAFPIPSVAGLQNRPVANTAPSVGQALTWNGTTWAPGNVAFQLPFTGSASVAAGNALSVTNTNTTGRAIFGSSPAEAIYGSSSGNTTSSYGIYGINSVSGNSGAIGGINGGASGLGVNGKYGVFGSSDTGTGILGTSTSGLAGDFAGVLRTSLFRLTTGAAANRYLVSDASGNGTWTPLSLSGISAGGDLAVTYPNPLVAAIQGRSVSNAAPTNGQTLVWNGTTWAPTTISGLTLPFSGSGSQGSPLFSVTNTGAGTGVFGSGKNGVEGASVSLTDSGVWGHNDNGGYGVSGSTNSLVAAGTAGVWGNNTGSGIGVKGTAGSTGFAGYFSGRGYFSSNVGIGTASPSELLHVIGNLRVDGGDIRSSGSIDLHPDIDASGDAFVRFLSSNGSEQARFTFGKFGIGTTSPAFDLALRDNDSGISGGDGVLALYANGFESLNVTNSIVRVGHEGVVAAVGFGGGGTGEQVTSDRFAASTNPFGIDFKTGGNSQMSVTLGGNVGVGTRTPSAKLHVAGDGKFDSNLSYKNQPGVAVSQDSSIGQFVGTNWQDISVTTVQVPGAGALELSGLLDVFYSAQAINFCSFRVVEDTANGPFVHLNSGGGDYGLQLVPGEFSIPAQRVIDVSSSGSKTFRLQAKAVTAGTLQILNCHLSLMYFPRRID